MHDFKTSGIQQEILWEHFMPRRRMSAHGGLMLRRCHDAICTPSPFILSCEAMWLSDNILPSEICVESLWHLPHCLLSLPLSLQVACSGGMKERLHPPHEICSGSHSAARANLLTNLCYCRPCAVFAWWWRLCLWNACCIEPWALLRWLPLSFCQRPNIGNAKCPQPCWQRN